MNLKLLAAAVAATLGSVSFNAGAANLGLDAACALNGTDRGMVATPEGSRRRCDLPADIVTTNPSDPIVTLPASVQGTPILWAMPSVVVVGNGNQAGRTPSTARAAWASGHMASEDSTGGSPGRCSYRVTSKRSGSRPAASARPAMPPPMMVIASMDRC